MRAASWLCIAALAGCSAQANVRIGTGATTVAPGTSVTTSSVGAQVRSTSAAGTLLAIGILAAAWYGSDSDGYGVRDRSFGAAGAVPQLDEMRRVNEQECTRPIEDWSANLKCK